MNKYFYKKGFTALELLVAVAILVIIVGVTIPQFSQIRSKQVLKDGASDIISSLHKAQSQTLASLSSSEYGVHFQSSQIVIFTGKTYSAGTSSNETISITSPATITNVTLGGVSGTSGDLYFNRLSGTPSTTGTITVSNSSISKIITISASGAISSN